MTILESARSRKPESANLAIALTFAKAGFPVIPCKEEGPKGVLKKPYTLHGFKDATTDEVTIRAWWDKHPGALVAFPTGEATGVSMLDLDKKDGKDGKALLLEMGLLPRSTVLVETASGGRHMYFRHTPGVRNTTSRLPDGTKAAGIDVRGEGGYAIAPGSVLPDGSAYRSIKGDLLETPLPPWPEDLAPKERHRPLNDNLDPADLSLDEAAAYLADIPLASVDERSVYLDVIFALADAFGDEARETVEGWAKQSDKFKKRDFAKDWKSAFRHYDGERASLATVIRHARDGWTLTSRECRALFEEDEDAVEADRGIPHWTPDQCGFIDPARRLVKGFIAEGQVVSIIGATSTGKSNLAIHAGYMAAMGRPFFGMRTPKEGSRIMYLAAEDEAGIRQRVSEMGRRYGSTPNFRVYGDAAGNVRSDTAYWKKLVREIRKWEPHLIFIDTRRIAIPAYDENDSNGTKKAYQDYLALTRICGSAVVDIHHPPKNDTDGGGAGSNAFHSNVHTSLWLRRDAGGTRGTFTKNKNGSADPDREILRFVNEYVSLGEDDDGDPLSTTICAPVTDFDSEGEGDDLSLRESAALKHLARLGEGGVSVSLNEWKRACVADDGFARAKNPDSRRKAFDRVRGNLIEKRRVRVHDGTVALLDRITETEPEDFDDE